MVYTVIKKNDLNFKLFFHRLSTDKKETVYVYCRSGGRSARASAALAEKGFKIVNLNGGILGWQRAQYPIAK